MKCISPPLQMAFRVSTGVALAEALGFFLNIQYDYWATMTVFLIMCPSWGATIQKGLKRLGMTILGCSFGFIIYLAVVNSLPALILCLAVSLFLMIYVLKTSYNWCMFYGGNFIVFLFGVDSEWSFSHLFVRICATAAGCVIAIIVSRFVFPSTSTQKYSDELPEVFQKLKSMTENTVFGILKREKKSVNMPSFYNPRTNSFDADISRLKGNHLFASYESILKKPSGVLSKEFIDILGFFMRNLGYLMRLSREIKKNNYSYIFYEVILELSGSVEGKLDYIISRLKGIETPLAPECVIDVEKISELYVSAKKEGATEDDLLAITAIIYYQRKMNENLNFIIEMSVNK